MPGDFDAGESGGVAMVEISRAEGDDIARVGFIRQCGESNELTRNYPPNLKFRNHAFA
jgi:hypothetical protein